MMTEISQFVIECLNSYYLIQATAITLLPLGADMNAATYKVEASDHKIYFVKIKNGHFDDTQLSLIKQLQRAGIKELIVPIKTVEGHESSQAGNSTLIVYPFVEGQDGFSRSLSDEQWIALGRALRQVHDIDISLNLKQRLRKEDFSSVSRDAVRSLYYASENISINDDIALDFFKFMQEQRSIIEQLVDRSEELSKRACSHDLKLVLCHSDIHAGNILLDNSGSFYIVDWDEPMLAPKERDLMFIGGGVGNVWNKPYEEKLFYQGYGQVEVDFYLLAYYRFERIVVDIAEYAQELLLKPAAAKDRFEMYEQFKGMFEPNGVVDIAFASAKNLLK